MDGQVDGWTDETDRQTEREREREMRGQMPISYQLACLVYNVKRALIRAGVKNSFGLIICLFNFIIMRLY